MNWGKGRFIFTEPLNAGLPPINFITQRAPQQDGVSEVAYFLQPRTITLHFAENGCGRDEYWQLRSALLEVTRPNRTGTYVTYYFTQEDGTIRAIRGRPVTPTFPGLDEELWQEWTLDEQIQIECFDPVWFDPALVSEESSPAALLEKEYTFGIPPAFQDDLTPLNTISNGVAEIAQLFYVYEECSVQSLSLQVTPTGAPTGTVTVNIETVTDNQPTGVLADANGTGTFLEGTLAPGLQLVTLTFTPFTLTPGLYAITITSDRADSDTDYIEFGAFYNAYLDALVSYWEMDEDNGDRLDSQQDNPLKENKGVGYAAGIQGNAAQFVAANSNYLYKTSNTDLQIGSNSCTFAVWVYIDNLSASRGFLSKYSAIAGGLEYALYINSVDSKPRFVVSSDGTALHTATGSSTLSINTWYLLIGYYDFSNNLIGISINAGTPATTAHTGGVYAGTYDFKVGVLGSSTFLMSGLIDEIGFWKGRVLSSGDRTALYNGGAGRSYSELAGLGLTTNLISYWSLDEKGGTRFDSHGSNDLTDPQAVNAAIGKQIQAAYFATPATKYLFHTDKADFDPVGDFTFSCWIKQSATGIYWTPIRKWDFVNQNSYILEVLNATNKIQFKITPDGTTVTTVTANTFGALAANTWYFVTCWLDTGSGEIGISVNGIEDTAAYVSTAFDSTTQFSNGIATGGTVFMDELGFWDRLLTSDERAFLYAAGKGTHFYDIRHGYYFRQSWEKLTALADWLSEGRQLVHDFLVTVMAEDELVFPLTFPFSFTHETNQFTLALVYPGTWYVYPVIIAEGTTNGFSIEHMELGKVITYLDEIVAGETVTITLGDKPTVVSDLNGDRFAAIDPVSDLIGFRIYPDPELAGGVNTFVIQAASTDDTTRFSIQYYVRYIGI